MDAATLLPHEIIILGDVNIHMDSQNLWAQNFMSILSDFDFIQHVFTTYTNIQTYS